MSATVKTQPLKEGVSSATTGNTQTLKRRNFS